MAAHAKFLFDTPLDAHGGGRSRAEEETDRAVAAAREQAFAEGKAEGRAQAQGESEQAIASRLDTIARTAGAMLDTLDEERERLARDAAGLAFAAARALAPALVAREPHGELDALFSECTANLGNAPHFVIRVGECDVAALRERLEKAAHAAGHDGRIVVLEEDGMAQGDCRIEWADGGVSRSLEDMTALVRQSIERRYGALGGAAAQDTSKTPDDGGGDEA